MIVVSKPMPIKLKRPCNHPGCPELSSEAYCPTHKRERAREVDRRRGTSTQRGYNGQWRKAREGYLRKHPICVECEAEGQGTTATVVDHIIPHKGDDTLFWDSNNWQALCKRCHDIKTVTMDGGFGNDVRS
ncbi:MULTISPECIES: HNH endonuclease [unclassified Paenibacillus]|uniref:HNH endonuclease n=2 Tax=Paenibacillus TaxID=44249 RepID=UPI00211BC721|nr:MULTISPECIES: HNH endonuclease signature motif containing protein [unclassified Paenibacillus]